MGFNMRININKAESIHAVLSKENMKTQNNLIKNINDKQTDKVDISSKAKEFNQLKSVVSTIIEDVKKGEDPEKLQRWKTDIAIGKYKIASEDIAEAIINPLYKKD